MRTRYLDHYIYVHMSFRDLHLFPSIAIKILVRRGFLSSESLGNQQTWRGTKWTLCRQVLAFSKLPRSVCIHSPGQSLCLQKWKMHSAVQLTYMKNQESYHKCINICSLRVSYLEASPDRNELEAIFFFSNKLTLTLRNSKWPGGGGPHL